MIGLTDIMAVPYFTSKETQHKVARDSFVLVPEDFKDILA